MYAVYDSCNIFFSILLILFANVLVMIFRPQLVRVIGLRLIITIKLYLTYKITPRHRGLGEERTTCFYVLSEGNARSNPVANSKKSGHRI